MKWSVGREHGRTLGCVVLSSCMFCSCARSGDAVFLNRLFDPPRFSPIPSPLSRNRKDTRTGRKQSRAEKPPRCKAPKPKPNANPNPNLKPNPNPAGAAEACREIAQGRRAAGRERGEQGAGTHGSRDQIPHRGQDRPIPTVRVVPPLLPSRRGRVASGEQRHELCGVDEDVDVDGFACGLFTSVKCRPDTSLDYIQTNTSGRQRKLRRNNDGSLRRERDRQNGRLERAAY